MPEILRAARLASTLAAAGAAAVAELGPTFRVPHMDVDAAMEMDLGAPIPVLERPGVLPTQTPTLQVLRRMYPVMRGNYVKPAWEYCDRRALFALDSRSFWDDIAGSMAPVYRAGICYLGSMRLC